MKKYLLGLSAVALAIGLNAFTTKKAKREPTFSGVYFEFFGMPGGEESLPNKWREILTYSCTCFGSINGCEIAVDDRYVTGSAPFRTIDLDAVPVKDEGLLTETPDVASVEIISPQNLN